MRLNRSWPVGTCAPFVWGSARSTCPQLGQWVPDSSRAEGWCARCRQPCTVPGGHQARCGPCRHEIPLEGNIVPRNLPCLVGKVCSVVCELPRCMPSVRRARCIQAGQHFVGQRGSDESTFSVATKRNRDCESSTRMQKAYPAMAFAKVLETRSVRAKPRQAGKERMQID